MNSGVCTDTLDLQIVIVIRQLKYFSLSVFPAIELEYPKYIKFIDDLVPLSNTFFQGAGGNENFLRTK